MQLYAILLLIFLTKKRSNSYNEYIYHVSVQFLTVSYFYYIFVVQRILELDFIRM